MSIQIDNFVPPLDDLLIYKQLLESRLDLSEKTLMQKMNQIHFDSFGKGLAVGLTDGGVETLKELGPFLANLVFHPIETTEEVLTAIQFILSKALEKDWETVFEALAPELKELFSNWDQIEDYHKGRLTGLFIGKNGVAALTALGGVKALSKLKHVVIGNKKIKFSCLLKKTKPDVAPLPASDFPLPIVPKEKGWHLPYQGGGISESPFYHEHALGRIAPDLTQNQSILEGRAIKKSQELGIPFKTWEEFEKRILTEQGKSLSIDFKEIPPSIVEVEIARTSSTAGKIEVILNKEGDVAAHVLQKMQDATKTGSILIKNKNVIHHVMQDHHCWEKVIELTGNMEKDFEKVLKFIEDNKIVHRTNIIDSFTHRYEPIIVNEYVGNINGYKIHAFMENYIESGEIFLKNAYVETF